MSTSHFTTNMQADNLSLYKIFHFLFIYLFCKYCYSGKFYERKLNITNTNLALKSIGTGDQPKTRMSMGSTLFSTLT